MDRHEPDEKRAFQQHAPNKRIVGEFKFAPYFTHAGYALIWIGLSDDGMIMMRKLNNRGRE